MSREYLFTSESFSEGHPDKIADLISDAVLDAYLEKDPESKVSCNTLITNNLIVISGEVSSDAKIFHEEIAKNVIREVRYTPIFSDFNPDACTVITNIKEINATQSYFFTNSNSERSKTESGIAFGYAVDETEEYMPLPISMANKIISKFNSIRKDEKHKGIGPDSTAQATILYRDGKPVSINSISLTLQHAPSYSRGDVLDIFDERLLCTRMFPSRYMTSEFSTHINTIGKVIEGGPSVKTGVSGRKLNADTYGGRCPVGSHFSGKDASKTERSAAYMARYIAKNIVAAELASECTIQLSYTSNVNNPISTMVDLHGTGKVDESKLGKYISEIFDLTPSGIVKLLQLKRPVFYNTAAYGHFGRKGNIFTWESTDRVSELKGLFLVN